MEHPYLFFSARELPDLKAKLKTEPFATRWGRLVANANRHLRFGVPRSARGVARPVIGAAGTLAFVYAITGEQKYGQHAKRQRFREGLLRLSTRVLIASVEKHHDWWTRVKVNNWAGVCHGGPGLAAATRASPTTDTA